MKRTLIQLIFTSSVLLPLSAQQADPQSLQFTKWTPDFFVPDPVAISFDHQGRAYVSQTQRRKANDLDIRLNRDWITDDLSFQSPDDKRAFYHRNFTPQNSAANANRVKDFNQDGKHDLKDLQFLSERIHLIEDTDGDGLADQTSIYAEGFTDEIGGIAAGVLHHEGAVYTTIVPDVWKLRDTDGDGKADKRESIASGFGAHLAYAGHDMHGLTVGVDGRIYWTIGDKGLGATSKEGLHFKFPNHGAVLRCEPDGSNFEVFARGLRNVQELAFDQFGNIFSIDNDSDRPGEKERFVYIVRHMDAGWRSNWQYIQDAFNPWMDEKLWEPYHEGQPAYILPAISLYEDGPAGTTFNPGTALNEEWANYFFHTSAPNGQQWAFQVAQNGASYNMVNDVKIGNGVPIVGINFGPDGALYGVDWGGGYPLNEQGAVWKWDVKDKHPLRDQTAKYLRLDSSSLAVALLVKTLDFPDQRVRLKAQFELVKRNLRAPLELAAKEATLLGRIHALWGIGQLNRKLESPDFKFLLTLLNDPEEEIRTQVVKMIGDHFGTQLALHQAPTPSSESSAVTKALLPLLQDSSDRLKFHAAIAIANIGSVEAQTAYKMVLQNAPGEKTYLRHAAVLLAAGCAPDDELVSVASNESALLQKVAVVALRRRGSPAVAQFLNSPHEHVVAEAARAIHDDWTIPEAIPALASLLETTSWSRNRSLILRAINANFHRGGAEHALRVAKFATHPKAEKSLRLDALDALSSWSQPGNLDRVVGRYRPLDHRDVTIVTEALLPMLTQLLTDPDQDVQSKTMELARQIGVTIPAHALLALAQDVKSLPDLKIEALRGLQNQQHPQTLALLNSALTDPEAKVRTEALFLLAQADPMQAFATIENLLADKTETLSLRQAAVSLLAGALASEDGDALLKKYLSSFKEVASGLQLDFAEAALTRQLDGPTPDFLHTLQGGDAEHGKSLFLNHLAAQCIRCHKLKKGKGSDIGPNLESIGRRRDRASLLESLIEPQKEISKGYGIITLTLNDGSFVAGQFRKEENGIVEIRDAEKKVTKVKVEDIKERTPIVSTMPPMGYILKKREIRDLIEFLSTLQSDK
ncbi:MAG: PVC-type heme-binding CxxCH protein [Akkermansiaceae bacterium]